MHPPRRPMVVANWKMHKTPAEAAAFVAELQRSWWSEAHRACRAVLAPPFPCIPAVVAACGADSGLAVAAQNLHWEREGAFTGEVSGPMLAAAGCRYAIVGHSERRRGCGETDRIVNRKLRAALDAGLAPILCVGEDEGEREQDLTAQVLSTQLEHSAANLSDDEFGACILAYEPVWAIGTGRTAAPEVAQVAHALLRSEVRRRHGADVANRLTILYGGSVTVANFGGLIAQPDIDGGLVGGASLEAETFARLAVIAAGAESARA